MKAVAQGCLRILKWALILCTVLYGGLLLVNLRDEELSPEEQALAAYRDPPVADDRNAYLALVGFDAPAGTNPIDEGARRIAEHNAAAAGDPWGRARLAKIAEGKNQTPGADRLAWAGGALKVPNAFDSRYLELASAHAPEVQRLVGVNAQLVSRYRALQKLAAFSDTAAPDILAPSFLGGSSSQIRQLLLAQSAVDAHFARSDRAMDFLSDDIEFWRRVLAGGDNVIDKMVAVDFVAGDLHVIADLLATKTFDASRYRSVLLRLTSPLTKAEADLNAVFAKEFAFNAALLGAMPVEERRVNSESRGHQVWNRLFYEPFFKPNSTLNRSARLFSLYRGLSGNSAREFLKAQDEVGRQALAMSEFRIGWIYNPMGHILVGIAAPAYQVYGARVMDLSAYVNLVRAQLEWRTRLASGSDVSELLLDAKIEARNPYTDHAFHWDPADRSLGFEAASENGKRWGTKVLILVPTSGG